MIGSEVARAGRFGYSVQTMFNPFHRLFAGLCRAVLLLGGLSAVVAGPRPNILFAIADDWGAHAGAYGTRWIRTPAFDRVAREGILFTRAYTPNAKCAPSRACILTGRNSWQLKEAANHICFFPPEFKGWAEALGENGYVVGTTGKGWGPGVANDANGRPRQMTGKPFNARKLKPPAKGIGNNDYAGNFEDFLEQVRQRPAGRPWAFWAGAIEPHRGYEYGAGVAKGGKKLSDIDRVPGYWPDNETVRNDLLDYAYEVEYWDGHVARMLAALERHQLLENTLVIVTSDHGMPFPRGKGGAYEHSNHIPFAARWPRGIASPGRVVDDYISFVDLAPTFMDVADVPWSKTGMAPTAGRSLTDIFSSPRSGRVNPARDHVLIGMERHDIGRPHDWGYPIRGIIRDDTLYLRNFEPARWPACNPETGYLNVDASPTKTAILEAHRVSPGDIPWALCFGKRPAEELYDLRTDSDCVNNLAQHADWTGRRQKLQETLFARLKEQEDPRMFGNGDVFDKYPHASAANRNFYERYLRGEKMNTGWVLPGDFEKAPLD